MRASQSHDPNGLQDPEETPWTSALILADYEKSLSHGRKASLSPTIFKAGGFRFYFFSREEARIHVHVYCDRGEAKFWLEPTIELAQNSGLGVRQLRLAQTLIEEHYDEIRSAWQKHFGD